MILKNKLLLPYLASILLTFSTMQGAIKNIKDTYQILQPNYKHLSLVHGAIAWETGFIRRLYDFGQIFPVYCNDPALPTRKLIDHYQNLDNTHMTARLIHALFYRVPGSRSDADFGISKQLGITDNIALTKTIACVLAKLETLCTHLDSFKQAVNFLTTHAQNLKYSKAELLLSPLHSQNSKMIIDIALDDCRKLPAKGGIKALDKKKHTDCFMVVSDTLKALNKLFHHHQKNTSALLTPTARQGADMATVLLNALDECNSNNPDALFMPHTVHMIILGFLYKACSHNRTALAEFYTMLNTELNNQALIHGTLLDQTWINDEFSVTTADQAIETIKNIIGTSNDQNMIQKNVDSNFEEFVYCFQHIKSFSTPVGYETAHVTSPNGELCSFSDCLENSIRNFTNSISFNPVTNMFDLATLKQRMAANGNLPSSIETFLNGKYKNPTAATDPAAHNEWAQLCSNVPDALYVEKSKDGTLHYNLRASLKTLIIVLNHILGLQLFDSQQISIPDFIGHYFPLVAQNFGAKNFYFSQQENANSGDDQLAKDIDSQDLGLPIYSTLIFDDVNNQEMKCEFMTKDGHGEFRLYCTGNKAETEAQGLCSNNKFLCENLPSCCLLFNELENRRRIQVTQNIPNNYFFSTLFSMPLENTNFLNNFIEACLKEIMLTNLSLKVFLAIKDLFIRLSERLPDQTQQTRLCLKILTNCIQSYSGRHQIPDSLINQATQAAALNVVNHEPFVRMNALHLFKALIKNGFAFKESIQLATTNINHNNLSIRIIAKDLFEILAENGYVLDQVTQATIADINAIIAFNLFG